MIELKEQIEEARARVAHCRIKAERPSARLEDEYALEKARTRLLTLELKELRQEGVKSGLKQSERKSVSNGMHPAARKGAVDLKDKRIRTNHERKTLTVRQAAEKKFAALQKGVTSSKEGC
ncbi:hypothetical protein [Roseibium sp. SCP14]|uniref:hypothetical protein n=1 Tax=Roseibium sp. SCP14 TaxID=3141375 RepID=UPI0033352BF3